ncbi:retrotransposon-related protein, partial [Trifolium pratense]
MAEINTPSTPDKNKWTIFVDGSSNPQGSGAGIILENNKGVLIEVSLELAFSTTNNQAEYEAFLAGLRLAEDMEVEEIKIFTNSQLVASQVSGEYQTKDERLTDWMTPVFNFLNTGSLPNDKKEAAKVKRRTCAYVILNGKMHRRGFSIPLLKCVEKSEVNSILSEIHEGMNGQHIGGRSLARKALRA